MTLEKTKFCYNCKLRKPTNEFYAHMNNSDGLTNYCKPCCLDTSLEYKHGITRQDYNKMYEEQNGKCAICKSDSIQRIGHKRLHVDHDHKTGKIRGLLCYRCNRGLGCFNDSIELLINAAEYLL